ncbi:MAG: anion transporter [Candidatus Eremiobacterota bacterium]
MSNSVSLIIIIITIIGIAAGHYPKLRMNRATISLVGACALIVSGAISLEKAYHAIDWNTIVLILSVMIINVNLSLSGFFRLICSGVVRFARTPAQLLAIIIVISGILSALFLNDTVVIMFTPLVLDITLTLKRNPVPYLIGLVTAANIGSTCTITGNPQNMIIGMASHIPFTSFTYYLFPVSLTGLFIAWLIIMMVYRHECSGDNFQVPSSFKIKIYKPLLYKSLVASGLMLVAFICGAPIPLAALAAASILLITRRLKPDRVFREIDWSLLVFFAGLFVVTGAIETAGFSQKIFSVAKPLSEGGIVSFTFVSAVLSNLVSNVPAVLLFRPFVPYFHDPQKIWLSLAMATTLAGNLTLLGSVANLIVAESARRRNINITFLEYLKAGVPVTILTLIAGIIWLSFCK